MPTDKEGKKMLSLVGHNNGAQMRHTGTIALFCPPVFLKHAQPLLIGRLRSRYPPFCLFAALHKSQTKKEQNPTIA